MLKVLAIDDEPLALRQLAAYIQKMPFFQLVAQCRSALEARTIMDSDVIDAIFCDINMPDLSGMDFVRELPVRPIIVFTTAYSEYAIEGYKVDAVDYLLKPFGLSDFQRAAVKVRERWELEHARNTGTGGESTPATPVATAEGAATAPGAADDTLFVKTDYKMVRLRISDIRYVEGMSEYLRIYVDGQPKPVITLLSMKKLEERLPANFMRIHRSYIVNLDKIQEVNKNRIILDADTNLPVGDLYKEQFAQYLGGRYLGK
ncbi:MAG: response regulator transcription factor [Prevotella sp.]|nr:response regulator transcription factor [Prevotella sp.]